jgi:hypothetical protein
MSTTRLNASLFLLPALLIVSTSARAVAEDPAGQAKTPRPAVVTLGNSAAAGQPVLRVEADCRSCTLPLLSWDSAPDVSGLAL